MAAQRGLPLAHRPFVQQAAWRRPVAWAARNASVYSRASLHIYHERRRVQRCLHKPPARSGFADGAFAVSSMQWRKQKEETRCARRAASPASTPSAAASPAVSTAAELELLPLS